MHDIPEDIVIKARDGEIGSFEALYKCASGMVYTVAYRIVHNGADAEEVTQEVFMKIYHELRNFRMDSSFKTWAYRITVNCAINHAKKAAKAQEKEQRYRDDIITLHDPTEKESLSGEEKLRSLLGALNPDQRACIVLRNIEGLSYEEIAGTLRVNINTVRTRLKRAREILLGAARKAVSHEM
jgi:RNA polymerase sigma-70 factor (ECF subfamily)